MHASERCQLVNRLQLSTLLSLAISLTHPAFSLAISHSHPDPCQVDTVANFHGLERLIVLVVGADEVGSEEAFIQSRARLYCAVTRAQLFVVVVNEFLRGGCTEFLGHVELQGDRKMEKGEVNREAAGALMAKKKKQMTGEAPELGEVSGSASADPPAAGERQGGGTDQTASRVSSPRPP